MWEQYLQNLADNKEIYLKIKVIPSAGKTAFLECLEDGTLRIALKAAPEKGKANLELIKFLAAELKVGREAIKIIGGLSSRTKLIKISA
jgi:hypothetical protein